MISTADTVEETVQPNEIRQVRETLGLTQQEVAEALGYRQGTIAKFELGRIPISPKFVRKWNETFLAKLGTTPSEETGKVALWKGRLQLPLAPDCAVRIEFSGKVTRAALRKLIQHLELTLDAFPVEETVQ